MSQSMSWFVTDRGQPRRMQERGTQDERVGATGGPGQALFRFVRYWSRRWTGADQAVDPERGRDVMVTEAVQALETRGGATVNDVADELGIDQSGASRFIAQAVDRGYLRKIASPRDARQRLLVITDEGATFLATAHRWQEHVFAELTAKWSPAEITQFHQLMKRLMHAQNACDDPKPLLARRQRESQSVIQKLPRSNMSQALPADPIGISQPTVSRIYRAMLPLIEQVTCLHRPPIPDVLRGRWCWSGFTTTGYDQLLADIPTIGDLGYQGTLLIRPRRKRPGHATHTPANKAWNHSPSPPTTEPRSNAPSHTGTGNPRHRLPRQTHRTPLHSSASLPVAAAGQLW